MRLIACRVAGSILREETINGRQQIIVPVVAMVEGVHQGIVGPNQPGPRTFYSFAELSQAAASLSGVPVTLFHPMTANELVSATSPAGQPFVIGRVQNVSAENNQLKAEVALDVAALTLKSPEALASLRAGQPMDVSLGIIGTWVQTTGVWHTETYDEVVTNISFDHLALLPGATGACSWADGCGVRANETTAANPKETTMPKLNTPTAVKTSRLLVRYMEEYTAMEASHGEIRDQLWNFVNAMDTQEYTNFLRDTYDGYFIYETSRRDPMTGTTVATKLYKRGYSVSDKGVVTVAEAAAEEVVKKTEYIPVDNATIANATPNQESAVKEQLIQALIASDRTPYSEEDRPWLTNLSECQLKKLDADNYKPAPAAPTTVANAAPAAPAATPAAPVTVAAAAPTAEPAKPVTVEAFLAAAPKEVGDVLRSAIASHETITNALIDKITACQGCAYTKEELKLKDLGELQKIAALANVKMDVAVDYSGAAGAPRATGGDKVPVMPSTKPEAPTK